MYRSRARAFASRLAALVAPIWASAALCAGCQGDLRATLVALIGCGLDGAELSSLVIVPRGDFPAGSVDATRAEGGMKRLPDLPDDVAGITVEGRFQDIVEAVGRTARLDDDGDLPIYFAPPDELCVVPTGSSLGFREDGALAVGPMGDIVFAGGRDQNGAVLDDIARARDVEELVTPLSGSLPGATAGLVVVPMGERRFAAIGGARSDGYVLEHLVEIDLDLPAPVADPLRIRVDGLDDVARAYAGAVVLASGRSLVTGGCSTVDLGDLRCDATAASHILRTSFVVDPLTDPPSFSQAPSHIVARYNHELLRARDGVVFAVGGHAVDGRGVVTIERLRFGAGKWETYGPTEDLGLAVGEAIVGATLMEGGLIVVATSTGGIGWVSETAADRWWQPGDDTFTWCDGDASTPGCFHDESLETPPAITRRRLLTLPDERVLADAFALPIAQIGTRLGNALDLSLPQPGQLVPPPGRRVGADVVALADGTVLFAGGRDPDTFVEAGQVLLRFRPELDGPDERIPEIDDLEIGSFVAHDPAVLDPVPPLNADERVKFEEGKLTLVANSAFDETIPEVWAHIRSFRSASFRFEVTLEVNGDARPHLVLSHGAVARTSIRFGDRIEGVQRGADGAMHEFTCSTTGIVFKAPQALRFDVTPGKIVIKASGFEVGCPGVGDLQVALGIGASNNGIVRASGMRLTRI